MKKFIVVACVMLMSMFCGCRNTKINDIPLTEGEIPYVLPIGTYYDIDGVEHVETHVRWSMSQEDVFNYVKWLRDNPLDKK